MHIEGIRKREASSLVVIEITSNEYMSILDSEGFQGICVSWEAVCLPICANKIISYMCLFISRV
jgi:hypothetical protein